MLWNTRCGSPASSAAWSLRGGVLSRRDWVRIHPSLNLGLQMRHFHLRRDPRINSNGGLRAEILENTLRHFEVPDSNMEMPWLPASSLSAKWLLIQIPVLFSWAVECHSSYFCSKAAYNSPIIPDCAHALAALPQADEYYRFYVEPQVETAPPKADWQGWIDERPLQYQRKVIQVPKFWNYGKHACLRT